MSARISTEDAARRLGVKRETLYAYVSRGVLSRQRSPRGRTSTFDRAEIERLARRGRPRRSTRGPAIDVTVYSAITRIERGHLLFRDEEAVTLAGTVAFEQTANLLWQGQLGAFRRWPAAETAVVVQGGAIIDRMRAAAALAALDAPSELRQATPVSMTSAAPPIIGAMVAAVGPPLHDRTPRLQLGGDAPRSLQGTTAARLAVRLSPRRPGPELVAALNAALVLLADHELAVSTLAARVAASARTDAFGVIGAGLGPLSGALHGAASRRVRAMVEDAHRHGAERAVRRGTVDKRVMGFGHALYPAGDPRAAALLARVRALPAPSRMVATVDEVAAVAFERTGEAPNVDFAVAALGYVTGMPIDAGDALFGVARSVGWIAHATEELAERPLRYRTRALSPRPE
ncbi:MAG TPA: citrate synthase [Acidimicrobiales bacterium]